MIKWPPLVTKATGTVLAVPSIVPVAYVMTVIGGESMKTNPTMLYIVAWLLTRLLSMLRQWCAALDKFDDITCTIGKAWA